MKKKQNQKKEGRGMVTKKNLTLLIFCLVTLLTAAPLTAAEQSAEELAKTTQNPIASVISLPFQNNLNFNYGPQGSPQNILDIQPVFPFGLSPDWNLITRTILPLVSQPAFSPGQDSQFGFGDTQFSAFLSPAKPGEIIWGAGMIAQLPTHTDNTLGSRQWGIGPTVVALRIDGPWVYGVLVNNVWSLSGDDTGRNQKYNNLLVQPFGDYNFGKTGTYICSSPVVTANWRTGKWVVPLGGGMGQIAKVFGNQPIDFQLQAFYNVVHPDNLGPEWQLRFQVKLLFPK
jgi:hypothetical protein